MSMPQDPFTYVGRVRRSADGQRVVSMDVIMDDDTVILSEKMEENEFITFTTVIDLRRPQEIPGE